MTACLDEEQVLALVEGRLGPDEVSAAEAHLHECPACADLVTSAAMLVASEPTTAADVPADSLEAGSRFGRYTILSLLGRGGMGEVHAAYDPQLDRRVALKVLVAPRLDDDAPGTPADTEGRMRLLREAKAIAKLSHPNVVAVHDAGEVDGRVFIAMEYVDGETLDAWLRARPAATRQWSEVVAMFLHAGRGLAAAHEAGTVHRDFKPQNVMVGKDGRVRVMDFGLATAPLSEATGVPSSDLPMGVGAPTMRLKGLTRTGALMGTPLYMAPEQMKGEPADERTDQFSFCVALYEGLYGERPFPSGTFAELSAALLTGRVRDRPARTNVPSWLRAVVVRGLAVRREDRHPSMEALLAQLERNPARRRRWIAAAALAVVAAVAGNAGVSWKRAHAAELCRRPARRLADLWEPAGAASAPRREAVSRAFQLVQRGFAAESLAAVTRGIDAYAARWTGAYADACDATHVRREQSTATLDLRVSCLEHALSAFQTLTDLLSRADPALVTDSVVAVGALPDLGRCDDAKRLMASVSLPEDPRVRQQVERLRGRLAEITMLGMARRGLAGVEEGRRAVAEARAIGFQPAVAEALLTFCSLQRETASDAATTSGEEAFWLAMRLGEEETAEQAAYELAVTSGLGARHAEAQLWTKMTETLLTRLGAGHDLEWSWYWQDVGSLALRQGGISAAREAMQKALELKRKVVGDQHPDVGISMCSLAAALLEEPDYASAIRWTDQGLPIIRKGFGATHPEMATCLNNRGEALNGVGRFRDALADLQAARAILAENFGADDRLVAFALNGMGVALLGLHDVAGAKKALEEALAIRDKNVTEPIDLAETRFTLARALWEGGETARALSLARSARETYAHVPELAPRLRAVDHWLASRRHASEGSSGILAASPDPHLP